MPVFDFLGVFSDTKPRGGAEQMALDEALLEFCTHPVLRVYCWDAPAVSLGYAQSLADAERGFPGRPPVRRWTGGGLVEHGRDWTFSLIVPAGEPLAAVRPSESYRQIHAVIAAILGNQAGLLGDALPAPRGGGSCFVRPVRDDVLAADGHKVCGGAQRRTRRGFLHQGSVQHCSWPDAIASRAAAGFARRSESFAASPALESRTLQLVREKYGTRAWLEKVP